MFENVPVKGYDNADLLEFSDHMLTCCLININVAYTKKKLNFDHIEISGALI